jgi:hypothetical protein
MMYRYSVSYRRTASAMGPVHRMTVIAADADDARREAARLDPAFGATVVSPRRLGVEPEQADPITAAKARELIEDEGTAYFEDDEEWTNREGMPEFNGAFR